MTRRANEFEALASRFLQPSENQDRWTDQVSLVVFLLYAFFLGVCFHLAFAPYAFFPAFLLSVGGLAWLVHSKRDVGSLGVLLCVFAYGLGKYGAGLFWIHESVHGFGGAKLWVAIAVAALLATAMAVFTTIFLGVPVLQSVDRSSQADLKSAPRKRDSFARTLMWCLLFSGSWILAEGFLAHLGFLNWLTAGVALIDTPLEGYIPIGEAWAGLFGVFTAAVLGLALRRPMLLMVLAPVLIGAYLLAGVEWTTEKGTRAVAIVQADIPLERKWRHGERKNVLSDYLEMSRPIALGRVVVWPEIAVVMEVDQLKEELEAFLASTQTTLVTGAFLKEKGRVVDGREDIRWYNVAIALGEGEGTYKKKRLVPFGEYVPFGDLMRNWIDWVNIPMNDFTKGPRRQKALKLGSDRAGVAICYEIAYPFTDRSSKGSSFFLALSEDGWFGDSNLPHQHLQIARVRALESGKAVVRSTNRGISAIILPDGSVQASLPLFTKGVLTAEIPLMTGNTPAEFGYELLNFLYAVLAILLGILAIFESRGSKRARAKRKAKSQSDIA